VRYLKKKTSGIKNYFLKTKNDSMVSHLVRLLGDDLFAEVCKSKILVVGAGGIGCELVKDLVQTGFVNLELIDLDTIDVSNLNRQFLFRSRHVGMSKSLVAKEVASLFNPDANIAAHHGNIKEEQFGLNFFKKFDMVLNALDNVNARQHVNRVCLAAGIPLLDSGTTGYLGQTTVIMKGATKCYDCDPKTENTKNFPICTIRNTPEKPVHCIVWAKELYKLLFGRMDESMLSGNEVGEDEEDNEATAAEKEVRSSIMSAVTRPDDYMDDENKLSEYGVRVFEAVFNNEIKLKLAMRDGYKGAKKKPTPLSYAEALLQTEGGSHGAMADQRVWSLKECVDVFLLSIVKMYAVDRRGSIGDAAFDKDDALALDFVTASSNLRSFIFGIEQKSKFDVKGIAGNIIHAIATTNAIVAGLQVLDAVKLLANIKGKPLKSALLPSSSKGAITRHCSKIFVVREAVGPFLLGPDPLENPNSQCYSCGNAVITIHVDTASTTLDFLVHKVLKGRFGMNTPTVMVGSSEIYTEGDDLDEDEVQFFRKNLPLVLAECPAGGIKSGCIVDIEDNTQNMSFKLIVQHKEFDEKETPSLFEIDGEGPVAKEDDINEPNEESDYLIVVECSQKRAADVLELPKDKKTKF